MKSVEGNIIYSCFDQNCHYFKECRFLSNRSVLSMERISVFEGNVLYCTRERENNNDFSNKSRAYYRSKIFFNVDN